MTVANAQASAEPVTAPTTSKFDGASQKVLAIVSVVTIVFHVWTAGAGPLTSFRQTSIHVMLAVIVCMLNIRGLVGSKRPTRTTTQRIDNAIIVAECIAIVSITVYVFVDFTRIVYELGYARPTNLDVIFGVVMLVVVFDAARRAMGWAFPVIGVVVICYALFGHLAPYPLDHPGIDFDNLIGSVFISPLGMFGSVTATSATQIAIFVIFGGLLMAMGGGDGFLKLAMVAAGRLRGGPGKVAVLSSALFGMVNGSAVANTASTGAITIPMMKKYGFSRRFAAAVEATASTGGQWTPPVMGAAVFLMAQLLGVTYVSLILAAAIPALIYYISFWMTVDAEAKKTGLHGVPREEIPKIRTFVDEIAILVPPVVVLGIVIGMQYPIRIVGFAATATLLISATLVHFVWKKRSPREFLRNFVRGCTSGAITLATIGALVAASQVVVAVVGSTGMGLKIGSIVFSVAAASVILALVLAAVINIVLGLALPTVPSYLIAIAITGPVLLELGVEPLAVHMFALYFAVIGGLTPPIGATVFVASAIAETGWFRASITALRIAAIAIVLPFIFVYRPELLLIGTPTQIVLTAISVGIGGVLLAILLSRYSVRKMAYWEIAVAACASLALFWPSYTVNLAGFIAAVALAGFYLNYKRKQGKRIEDTVGVGATPTTQTTA